MYASKIHMDTRVRKVLENRIAEKIENIQQHVVSKIQASSQVIARERVRKEAAEREAWEQERDAEIEEEGAILQAEMDEMERQQERAERERTRDIIEGEMMSEALREDERCK